jgi:TonB family protein
MPKWIKLPFVLFLLGVLIASRPILSAQQTASPLPKVTEHAEVKYPRLARQTRIQGQVRLEVTTDGHAATNVTAKEGHPLLAQSAVENVRTWKFVDHVPGTFDVTFKFHLLEDPVGFLQQPGIVEVLAAPERYIDHYTLPEKWNARIRDAQGTIDTTLTLWTYHGYGSNLDGYTTGPQGQERAIRNSHISGDMLGFDATVQDKHGQRLKFSMIGKMTGDKIKGVFLNYWVGCWRHMDG